MLYYILFKFISVQHLHQSHKKGKTNIYEMIPNRINKFVNTVILS